MERLMKTERISGKSKESKFSYSDIRKLSKKKNITPEAAKRELMNKKTEITEFYKKEAPNKDKLAANNSQTNININNKKDK